MNNLEAKIRQLHKSDVHNHLHLGGDLELLKRRYPNINLDIPLSYNGLDGMISFIQNDLNRFINSEQDVLFLMENAIRTSIEDNVTYLEASIDIGLVKFFDNSIDKLITLVNDLKDEYSSQITFEPDIGINKDYSIDKIYSDGIKCLNSTVFKGIDIYGKEKNQNLDKFVEIFAEAKKEGVKTKVHIGEFSDADSIEEAISLLKPHEIQHGIRAVDSENTMAMILDQNIQLNVCPQSNLALGATKNNTHYELRQLFDYGIKITINTDDFLLFNSSISNQYLNLIKKNIFSIEEINLIRKNSLPNHS